MSKLLLVVACLFLLLSFVVGYVKGSRCEPEFNYDFNKGIQFMVSELVKDWDVVSVSERNERWYDLFMYKNSIVRPRHLIITFVWTFVITSIVIYLFVREKLILYLLAYPLLMSIVICSCQKIYKHTQAKAYRSSLLSEDPFSTSTKVKVINAYRRAAANIPYMIASQYAQTPKWIKGLHLYKHHAPKGATPRDLLIYLLTGLVGIAFIVLIIKGGKTHG